MKIPKDLLQRFFCEGNDVRCKHIRTIISAMREGFVLEFIYRDNGESTYMMAAPICVKYNSGQWLLLGLDHENKPKAYDIDNITNIGEHWETITLPANFDYHRFAMRF